jgi:hypothetical protein
VNGRHDPRPNIGTETIRHGDNPIRKSHFGQGSPFVRTARPRLDRAHQPAIRD